MYRNRHLVQKQDKKKTNQFARTFDCETERTQDVGEDELGNADYNSSRLLAYS